MLSSSNGIFQTWQQAENKFSTFENIYWKSLCVKKCFILQICATQLKRNHLNRLLPDCYWPHPPGASRGSRREARSKRPIYQNDHVSFANLCLHQSESSLERFNALSLRGCRKACVHNVVDVGIMEILILIMWSLLCIDAFELVNKTAIISRVC